MLATTIISETQDSILLNQGYLFKNRDEYAIDCHSIATKLLINEFNNLEMDKSPGSRYRAYLKLHWNRKTNLLSIAKDQKYYQTYGANNADGGKFREFKILSREIYQNITLQKIIKKNLEFIRKNKDLEKAEDLIFGIHFIRYHAEQGKASYSSPTWLHIDDEPLVFLHLIQLSDNLIGGDTIIAGNKGVINSVFRLKNFMDTVVLTRHVRHAVTPMGSLDGTATRDIILFTIEPASNQE